MFTGSVGNKRRVNLGGSSKGAESREQVLERSKLERDRRKRNKLENASATTIQVRLPAAVRGCMPVAGTTTVYSSFIIVSRLAYLNISALLVLNTGSLALKA